MLIPIERLPTELVVRILSELDGISILFFCSINHHYRSLLENTVSLQYRIELRKYQMEQYSYSALPVGERLSFLQERESSWRELSMDQTFSIKIPNTTLDDLSMIIRLGQECNMIVLSDGLGSLSSLMLPNCSHKDLPVWSEVSPGSYVVGSQFISEVHDLLAVVTRVSAASDPENRAIYKLHFLQFSTLKPHPLAAVPEIEFTLQEPNDSMTPAPAVVIDFAEVLFVTFFYITTTDRIKEHFVADWKSGKISKISDAMSTAVDCKFVKIFVVPIWNRERIDIMTTGYSQNNHVFRLLRRLSLPKLKTGFIYWSANFDNNPTILRSTEDEDYFDGLRRTELRGISSHGIRRVDKERIVVFNIFVEDEVNNRLVGKYVLTCRFDKLVEIGILNTVELGGPFNERVIPWEKWGPDICRWDDVASTTGTTCYSGQRHIVIQNNGRFTMKDYNPFYVKSMLSKNNRSSRYYYPKVVVEPNVIPRKDWFESDIVTRLPFVEMKSAQIFQRYCKLMMSEDNLVGLREDYKNNAYMLDVFMMTPENRVVCGCDDDADVSE